MGGGQSAGFKFGRKQTSGQSGLFDDDTTPFNEYEGGGMSGWCSSLIVTGFIIIVIIIIIVRACG